MKQGKVERGPWVRRDLLVVFTRMGRSSPRTADRFLEAAEKTFRQLSDMPGMGEPHDPGILDLAPIRRCLVTRFENYLVYYMPIDGGIRVLRVVHAAREPEDLVEADDFE